MHLRETQLNTLRKLRDKLAGEGTLRDLADACGVEPTTTRNAVMRLQRLKLVKYATKGKGRTGTVKLLALGTKVLTPKG